VLVDDAPALDACRPFQEGSRGFAGGEASVAFVLTRRPVEAYASLLGGAMNHDGHHVTNLDPSHDHVSRVVTDALTSAQVEGYDIAYLNAHGPGTAQCDAAEAAVSAALLPNAALYSLKPLVGHCQGAAALVEVAGACLAYEHGTIPAPEAVAPGDPRLLSGPTPAKPGLTVKTSIGLGGHNSAVVLGPGQ
jgi:3-oxoacyl-[acyl-carrier-protein] synthase II